LNKIIPILLLLLIFASCGKNEKSVYRAYLENSGGYEVWAVDGAEIRKKIFDEFLYGGNSLRYPFVPENEIWIDNAISCEEYLTTLKHEIRERELMKAKNLSYFEAHDSALALEYNMRKEFKSISRHHEDSLGYVYPFDFDSVKEITDIPDSIRLTGIYKIPLGDNVWVVDGYKIRSEIYPDFGFSGNYMAYSFIPEGEIWIDGSVSVEEMMYSIALEKSEISLLNQSMIYDSAYVVSARLVDSMRSAVDKVIAKKPALKIPNPPYKD
jgi:hypothetical protein